MYFRPLARIAPCLMLLGCSSFANPYVTRYQAQRKVAAELRPAALEERGQTRPTVRPSKRLALRIYADAAYERHERNMQRHIKELVERANEVLQNVVQARLEIESIRPLPAPLVDKDLDVVLKRLAEADPGNDVAFVLAFIGQDPIMTFSFHQLGRAEWLGKHLTMRCLDDVEEMRALASSLDTLSTEARTHLYAERKRHKETAVLLHELGHSLGAIHANTQTDLMHPQYHNTAVTFADANLTLMRYGLEDRDTPVAQRDASALVKQVHAYLTQNDGPDWLAGERDAHLQLLATALQRADAVQQQSSKQTAERATPVQPAVDLTGLTEQDQEKFHAIDAHRQEQRAEESYALVTELADRYKDNYAVQNKACELGMAFRVEPRFIMRYCARMSELRKAPKGD